MGIKFANLASTTLASGVNATATSISVTSASSFPTLGSGDYFYASIGIGAGSEIVKVTAVSGDTLTVVRAQDDTSASAHTSGVEIALRVTAKALEDINESANQTITLTGDVSGSGTDTISVSVTNDSHTHAFNNLTSKEGGTGAYSTTGHIEAGRGSGGVALTHNDGYGNANVTFNHRNGSPEQTGNAGRIEVNTDAASGDVFMSFEGKSTVSADTATDLDTMMQLGVGEVRVPYKISHIGDTDTFIAMEDDKVYIKTGNTTKWNSDNWTSNTEASVEFKFSGGLKTDTVTCATAQQLILNAGESAGKVGGQTNEYVYVNAEQGLIVNTPDSDHSNWQAGYTVDSTVIKGASITVDGNTVWHAGNDGSGSGLDADKLDNLESTSFLRSDANDSSNSILTLSGANPQPLKINRTSNANAGIVFQNEDGSGSLNYRTYFGLGNASGELTVGTSADTMGTGNKIWHAGNDGADSGLDADKLDGKHASAFPLVANGTVANDFNNYTTAGNYYVANWNPAGGTAISNGPTYTFNTSEVQNAYGWGMLRVSNFGPSTNNFIIQEYIPHQHDGIWMRIYWSTHGWTGWRQQYTNLSDGNSDGLNADTLDGQEGSYYLDYDNFSNKPTIPSISGLATESYVDTAVSNLVDTAPDALNTLNELAAAINDDASFASTVNTNIAAKVSKSGDTMTGALAIEHNSPTLTLKDTSDDDDHAIYFTNSDGNGISTIKSMTAVSGSSEDAFTFDSIRDIVFTRSSYNEKLRIDANGVDVTGDLDVSELVYGKAFRAEPASSSNAILSVLQGGVYSTVIDGDKDINCRNLDVDGTFSVGSTSNSQSMTFSTGTAGSDPAILRLSSVLESNTAQGDVYSALHFGVIGAETGGGNLTDGTIAAVKAIDCRSGSTSYEDGGLGFYTTDHDDANHKLRGYFGNSGGLHLTDDEGIEDNIAAGSLKVDGTITSVGNVVVTSGAFKIGGNAVITSDKDVYSRRLYLSDYADFDGTLHTREHLKVLDAAGTGWSTWATRSNGNYNLNVGTISSGVITTSGASAGRYTGLEVVNTTNAGGTETAIGLGVVSAGNTACDVKLVANRVQSNAGSDFYIEQTDSSGNQQETFRVSEAGAVSFTGTLASGVITTSGMIATDTSSTGRGIYRNNTAYDLRLGGGTDSDDGAFISISGETRGGTDSTYNGRLEYYSGGTGFANQAAILGDHVWKAKHANGSATLMVLDSATSELTISGNLTASGTTTTLGTTGEEDVFIDCLCTDDIFIKQNNTNRALFNSAGITSYANVYAASNSSFRNYSTAWRASTGLTGNGFEFFNTVDGTAATLSSTGELEIFGDLLMQDEKKLYLSTDTTTSPTYFHTNSSGHLEAYVEGYKALEMQHVASGIHNLDVFGGITTTAAVNAGSQWVGGGYFKASSASALLRLDVSSYSAGNQSHDIIYNGYGSNIGDYTYIKAGGNSATNHGIGVFGDNVFAVGTIDQNTGAVSNSATAPIDTTWMYADSTGLTVNGTIDSGQINTTSHGTSQNWYDAYTVSQNALSKTVSTTQNITGPVVHNGDVTVNDGVYIKVVSSDYTPPLRVERTGGTGATLATISTTGTYAAGFTFRNYYSGTIMHNQYYTGFYMGSGYIAPSANAQGYLGDGTVNLGSSSFGWGSLYLTGYVYTQESTNNSAPRVAYSCRAWGVVNQTGTQAILKDQGFSTITDLGTGKTRLNFTATMPDANYAVTANTQLDDLAGDSNDTSAVGIMNKTNTYVELANEDMDGGFTDSPNLSVVIHR